MENKTKWEAEFKMNGKNYSAIFGLDGNRKNKEFAIKESEIPTNVIAILDNNFSDYKIDEVEHIESSAGIGYEFEVFIDLKGN